MAFTRATRWLHIVTLLVLGAGILSASPTGRFKALRARDADFESVRTRLSKDHSGKAGDPKDKYFHESTFHPHYDGRFADKPLPARAQHRHLVTLMQAYLTTMHDIGAETWIMHGSLLGWWWNRKIMPWDSDVDVQMSEQSMHFLADYYNMTVYHFNLPNDKPSKEEVEEAKDAERKGESDEIITRSGRNYMLEVNPHYKNGSTTDRLNVIDARWVDMDTGLFIDITTLRRNLTAEALGEKGKMMCKDKHRYDEEDIFPLRDSLFEGMPVKIPYAYSDLLEEEYGPQALSMTYFDGYHFEQETMEWVKQEQVSRIVPPSSGETDIA